MKIAPIIFCSMIVCLVYAQSAQSFVLTKKLVAVKAPIVAAKIKLAKDVKLKVVAVAKKAIHLKKKAALVVATPIIAIKAWKKKLLAKKLAKLAGPIIALKTLKRAIIDKKLKTLAKIVPVAAGFGLGGLAKTNLGYAFTEWNGSPFELNDANSFVLVPEEYSTYHVGDSYAPRSFGYSGDFVSSAVSGAESTLETIGNNIPFLNTLTNGVQSLRHSLHKKPVYQFVPDLGFHKYSNVHYEPSVPVVVPTVPLPEIPHETYGPPQPYPPQIPEEPEIPIIPEVPDVEYGPPPTPELPPPPPAETYGPPPTDTYGPPSGESYVLPSSFSSQSFGIPSTSYGIPQGPSFTYSQRF